MNSGKWFDRLIFSFNHALLDQSADLPRNGNQPTAFTTTPTDSSIPGVDLFINNLLLGNVVEQGVSDFANRITHMLPAGVIFILAFLTHPSIVFRRNNRYLLSNITLLLIKLMSFKNFVFCSFPFDREYELFIWIISSLLHSFSRNSIGQLHTMLTNQFHLV